MEKTETHAAKASSASASASEAVKKTENKANKVEKNADTVCEAQARDYQRTVTKLVNTNSECKAELESMAKKCEAGTMSEDQQVRSTNCLFSFTSFTYKLQQVQVRML